MNTLSKWYLREQREVCFVEQAQVDRDAKRLVCRKCRRLWVPDRSERAPVTLRKGRKKLMATCGDCGAAKGIPLNTKYLSRNEKQQAAAEAELKDA